MTNEEGANVTGGGRSPRQGIGGSPVGSTLSIVLAVVAVIAGFLILRNITDDGGSGSTAGDIPAATDPSSTSTTPDAAATSAPAATTTAVPFVTEGATVVVANANTVGGSAGRMSKTLETAGFTMGDPLNATVTLDDSIVQFDGSIASAEAVAESVALALGGVVVEPLPTPPQVDGGDLGGAGVLLLLGNNEADKTLEELGGSTGTGAAPEPSGSETTTTTTTG
jgi:hypothetical protein